MNAGRGRVPPTISAPVWASVATGVHRDRHGIDDNDLRGHRLERHPDFLAIIRAQRPDATTFAAVTARPTRQDEEWTIIVVTDHGHRDAGHHGGDSDEERTAWIAASGPGIHASAGATASHVDVAAHALHTLGIDLPPGLDGRSWNAL